MSRRKSTSLPDSSRRQKHGVVTDDNINDLPDSILSHILSFLPTKDVVATAILSKRWNFLWTTAINLDFCCPQNYTGGAVEQFVQFVNYVLLLRKPGYFNKLSLTWEKGCIPFHVNSWITAALTRDIVHELFVSVGISRFPIHVQTYMFSNGRLRSLELNCSICITPEIVVSLPGLEHLKLISIYFQNEEAFRKLIDGCPLLKYLVIHMDIGKMIRFGYIQMVAIDFICIISSPSLRHLELYAYDNCRTPEDETAVCGVQLDAPSLQYIKLEDQINSIVIQERLNFLGEANIQFTHFEYEVEIPNYCNSFVEALDAFACAKTLNLSDEVIRALSCATIKMRARFTGLKRLEVTIDWNYWSSLQDFIKLSDDLEVLIVNKCEDYSEKGSHFNNSNWTKPDLVPRCLSKSLRTVSMGAYDGYPDELAMVDYIIKHTSVLKIMQICFGETVYDFKRKYELVQQISAFPRKSTTCEVIFL